MPNLENYQFPFEALDDDEQVVRGFIPGEQLLKTIAFNQATTAAIREQTIAYQQQDTDWLNAVKDDFRRDALAQVNRLSSAVTTPTQLVTTRCRSLSFNLYPRKQS
jgi:hypothetical protein